MNFLTEETPAKVVSLLGVALTSMAMLFVFTATNASFSGTMQSIPDPFSSTKVVAVIDNASADYSNFLAANLFQPAEQSYAMAADNVSWIGSNAKDSVVAMLGLPQPVQSVAVAQTPFHGRVAGAHIVRTVQPDQTPGS